MTKSDFSMQSVRTLFRLDLKSRYGISPDAGKLKKFAQFGNMLFFVLVYAVLVVYLLFEQRVRDAFGLAYRIFGYHRNLYHCARNHNFYEYGH